MRGVRLIRSLPTRIFLEVMAALAVLALIGAGALLWRLSHGPLPLDFARTSLERLLSNPAQGRQVAIAESELVWDRGDRAIELRAHGVRIRLTAAGPTASLPELSARFSLSGLAQGQLLPLDLTLVRPELRAIRNADGQIEIGPRDSGPPDSGPEATADGNPMTTLDSLLDTDPGHDLSLRLLSAIRVADGSIELDDRQSGRLWHLHGLTLTIARHGRRVTIAGAGAVDLGGTPVTVRASAALASDQAEMPLRLDADAVPTQALLGLLPAGAPVAYDGTVGGTVTATLTRAFRISRVGVDLSVQPGTLTGAPLAEPIAIQSGALKASADLVARSVVLEHAGLEFGGVAIALSGGAADDGNSVSVGAELQVRNVAADDLKHYWPPTLAPNPRRWLIANAAKGIVREAAAKVQAQYRRADDDWSLQALDGTLAFEKMRLIYLAGLPPAENVAGTGTFNAARMDLAITGGQLKRIRLESGAVGISGLDTTNQMMDISLLAKGPVADALTVLDAPRLGYIRRFGIQAASVAGDQTTRLTAQFPLVDKLKLDLVKLGAKANLDRVAAPAVFRGQALTDGRFDAEITRDGMQVTGQGVLAGVPLSVIWTEQFADDAPFRRRFDLRGTADDAARSALGIELAPSPTGPVGADVVYEETDARHATLHARLDLTQTAVGVDWLGWAKPAGTPAALRGDLTLLDGRFERIAGAQLDGAGISVSASGRFDQAGDIAEVHVAPLHIGGTDLSRVDILRGAGRISITATGARFDGTKLMAQRDAPDGGQPKPQRSIEVAATVGEVVLGPDRVIRQVRGSVRVAGDRIEAARIDGQVGAAKVEMTVAPRQGGRDLVIRATDAGSLLAATGLLDSMRGGQLVVSGRFIDAPAAERLNGHLEISNFRLVRLPVLARLVAVASITGIPEMLAGEGVAFRNLYADFSRTATEWQIQDSNAAGLALGLNLHGTVDRASGRADLAGTLVPANGINQVLNSIPLLGNILTGGPNGGFIAFVFSLTGPLDNPSVSVNPLSALTPGILRRIFELPRGTATPPSALSQSR